MAECGLNVKFKRKIKYNSYKGEITPAEKVYLSPIMDCFDGILPAWKISTTPDAMLVNSILDDAVRALGKTEHPLIQTEAVITAGPDGCPEWKQQDLSVPCQGKAAHRIIPLAKGYLGA